MTDILTRIQIGNKSILKGDMTKSYSAIIILAEEIKTETLSVGTMLPLLMKYKVRPTTRWPEEMQERIPDFIISSSQRAVAENKKVLVCSEKGNSRAPAALIRLLIKFGFQKADAIKIIKARSGFTPSADITRFFPDLDEKRLPVIAMKVFGPNKAMDSAKSMIKSFGLTDEETDKIPNLTEEEIEG